MKTDNGSAFIAEVLARFLARWQVLILFSPPRTPSYNGTIESSIGSLKTRSERLAAHLGHRFTVPHPTTSGSAAAD
jgi:transposase InsO family protein